MSLVPKVLRKPLWQRLGLLLIAGCLSLLITEFITAKVIKYPAYGIAAKVRYRNGGEYWTNIRKPHAKVYNVEGKNLAKYNNYGLPGVDIDSFDKPIVVLGSSFVEALQYAPPQIASSVFQHELNSSGVEGSVINLGCSGHDPYDSWFRLLYLQETLGFDTQDVILVLNSDNKDWFARHPQPLDFTRTADFGAKNNSLKFKIMLALRNSSSLVELFAKGAKGVKAEGVNEAENTVVKNATPPCIMI